LKLLAKKVVRRFNEVTTSTDTEEDPMARDWKNFGEFEVPTLGECTTPSPLRIPAFRQNDERVLADPTIRTCRTCKGCDEAPPSFEVAGPREKLFFDPTTVRAGVVTCGGLCPGLNDVIHGLVMELWHRYGTWTIYGFQYGYQGMIPRFGNPPMLLDPDKVQHIHEDGGTILRSSRGPQPVDECVDTLQSMGINQLFCVGGDGTLRGALEMDAEARRRGYPLAVVGIPKTIDNDIDWMEKSFGFETAFSVARESVLSAHVEADGAPNGIGLVKLMGRESGYVAVMTALAMSHVNFVLVPEVPFDLGGPQGLFEALRKRIERRRHAVIVVAEGAGQDLLASGSSSDHDASGNVRFKDIGLYLKDQIQRYFTGIDVAVSLKYIDPSYIIRSVPANAADSVYCMQLAQHAVHAAMAGKTGIVIGRWAGRFTHVPISMAVARRNKVDPTGDLWLHVLEATGQPASMKNEL